MKTNTKTQSRKNLTKFKTRSGLVLKKIKKLKLDSPWHEDLELENRRQKYKI